MATNTHKVSTAGGWAYNILTTIYNHINGSADYTIVDISVATGVDDWWFVFKPVGYDWECWLGAYQWDPTPWPAENWSRLGTQSSPPKFNLTSDYVVCYAFAPQGGWDASYDDPILVNRMFTDAPYPIPATHPAFATYSKTGVGYGRLRTKIHRALPSQHLNTSLDWLTFWTQDDIFMIAQDRAKTGTTWHNVFAIHPLETRLGADEPLSPTYMVSAGGNEVNRDVNICWASYWYNTRADHDYSWGALPGWEFTEGGDFLWTEHYDFPSGTTYDLGDPFYSPEYFRWCHYDANNQPDPVTGEYDMDKIPVWACQVDRYRTQRGYLNTDFFRQVAPLSILAHRQRMGAAGEWIVLPKAALFYTNYCGIAVPWDGSAP